MKKVEGGLMLELKDFEKLYCERCKIMITRNIFQHFKDHEKKEAKKNG